MSDTMLMPVAQGSDSASLPMQPTQLRARLARIQEVMRSVMEKDLDYGTIPGTDKDTLYKPGAEKLAVTFHLTSSDPFVEDLSDGYERRYRVRVPILAPTGLTLAVGVGECSSAEDKYAWRRPAHQKEYDRAPEDRRRIKYARNGDEWPQVRTNPADVANTILKMAHKRAYIHGVIMATGASSIFGQDLEDMDEQTREAVTGDEQPRKSTVAPPQRKSAPAPTTTPGAATVTNVTRKDGPEKNGKPEWTLWRVFLSDGREATTFHEGIALAATALKMSGVPVEIQTEPGKKAGSVNIVEITAVEREPGSDDR